jgi:hypothetical protein
MTNAAKHAPVVARLQLLDNTTKPLRPLAGLSGRE